MAIRNDVKRRQGFGRTGGSEIAEEHTRAGPGLRQAGGQRGVVQRRHSQRVDERDLYGSPPRTAQPGAHAPRNSR